MSIILSTDAFNNSLDGIIYHALLELNAISEGDEVLGRTLEDSVYRFNSLILALTTEVPSLHAIDTQSFYTEAGKSDYDTAVGTKRVLHFADEDINVLSAIGYDKGVTTDDGKTNVFVDHGTSPPKVRFVKTPEEAGVTITYRRERLPNVMTSSDMPEYPLEAVEMLILGLAWKLAPSYGVDPQRRSELKQDYESAKTFYNTLQTYRNGDEIIRPNFVV